MGENPASFDSERPGRVLKLAALWAILFNLGILLYFAAATSLWDDEVNSLFLSRLPLSDMLDLMSTNFDEDAPAFNLLQHFWQQAAHTNPFLLRLLPFILWLACVAGVGVLVNRLAGKRAMYWALIIVGLWPYHWIYPISMRWYSLAAALGVWNVYFFVRLMESQREQVDPKLISTLLFGGLVALTGAVLWYTVYFAPAIAVGELVVLLAGARFSLRAVGAFAVAWLGALILYLPWLPTFLEQLGASSGTRFSSLAIGSSSYVFWAGDFSIPTAFWISLPFLATSIIGVLLALKYWSMSKTPLVVGGVVLLLLLLFGTIEAKRLLLMTVFVSAAIGISVATAVQDRNWPVVKRVAVVMGILALIGFGGSLANIITKSGWSTYRWLDQVEETARRIESEHPGAIILSNSNAVAFYANDPIGLELARYRFDQEPGLVSQTKVWNSLLRTDPAYGTLMKRSITSNTDVIYVHHAFFNNSGSTGEMDSVLWWLQSMGFRRVDQWQSTPIRRGVERFMSLPDHPKYRITAIYLENTPGEFID